MKILFSSHFFHPGIGGTEEVGLILAGEFARAGHEVKVVTSTRAPDAIGFQFEIIRHPSATQLIRLIKWCDVFFHNNISLQTAWPLLFVHKPWVVAHHSWIERTSGRQGIRDWIKKRAAKYATNISVSEAVAKHLPVSSTVIGNPYRDQIFKIDPSAERKLELVFLGRLVRQKGVDLLLEALSLLKKKGLAPQLTIIGDGTELETLRQQAGRLGLSQQVCFAGKLTDKDLAAQLNTHKVMVIPSRGHETFGLAALEGIACGCVPAGADCGGLSDAIGPAGITFACGKVEPMARSIEMLLGDETVLEHYRRASEDHLAKHKPDVVARKYLEILEKVTR